MLTPYQALAQQWEKNLSWKNSHLRMRDKDTIKPFYLFSSLNFRMKMIMCI